VVPSLGRGEIRLLFSLLVRFAYDVVRERRVSLGHRQSWGRVMIWRGCEEVFLVYWDLIRMSLGRDLGGVPVFVSAPFKAADIRSGGKINSAAVQTTLVYL